MSLMPLGSREVPRAIPHGVVDAVHLTVRSPDARPVEPTEQGAAPGGAPGRGRCPELDSQVVYLADIP